MNQAVESAVKTHSFPSDDFFGVTVMLTNGLELGNRNNRDKHVKT